MCRLLAGQLPQYLIQSWLAAQEGLLPHPLPVRGFAAVTPTLNSLIKGIIIGG
jgi:hypothetical protein